MLNPTPTTNVSLTCRRDGSKIRLAGDFNPDSVRFINSLPGARFWKVYKCWTCTASPLACWQMREAGCVLDAGCAALADAWEAGQRGATPGEVEAEMFKTQPWGHQIAALEFSLHKPAAMLSLGMGSGKSFITVSLSQLWGVRKALILCPKAVVGVWRREYAKHYSGSVNVVCLEHSTGEARRKALLHGLETARNNFLNVFVINYESSWRDPVAAVLASQDWDMLALDEAHRCSDAQSRQGKFAFQLAQRSARRLCLTGTPMPSSILNLFGQYKILDPAIFGESFTRFRSRYALTHEEYRNKVLQTLNEDEFTAKFKLLAFGTNTSDVLDLPSLTYQDIPVTLSAKTEKVYRKMLRESYLELEAGEVTAQNAGVKLLRLAQIASGHTKNDEGEIIEVGDEKKQALKDLLTDINEPVVVFARFTSDLRAIEDVAKQLKRSYGEVSGSRKDLTAHATMPEGIDILGVQEQAGGVGIDLTRARIAIDFSRGYSLGIWEQKIARVHRPGQTRPTIIYTLIACNTVDEAAISALENKQEAIGAILNHVRWVGSKAKV